MSFLDELTFSTADPDAKALLKAVLDDYPLAPSAQTIVQEAGLPLASIGWLVKMEDVWPAILEAAAAQRRLRRLVKILAEKNEAKPAERAALYGRLLSGAPPPPPGDPYLVRILAAKRSLIDREVLRGHLKELVDPDGSRVLMVTGPQDAGKSHSWFVIDYLGRNIGPFPCRRIDLSTWVGDPAGPVVVMEMIADRLGWPPAKYDAKHDGDDTLLFKFTSWFVDQAARHGGPLWLVFDGLDGPNVGEGALRMVKVIAELAATQQAGEVRVVLLAYAPTLSNEAEPAALRELLHLVGVDEVKAFFEAVVTAAGRNPDPAVLERLVDELLGPPPHPDPVPLPDIGARAGTIASTLFAPAGGGG